MRKERDLKREKTLAARHFLRDSSSTMNINAHSTEVIADADLLGDRLRLRGRLALLGWPSLQAWSVHHRFDPTAVHHALSKWAKPRSDGRRPHGKASAAIISSLRATLAEGRTFGSN